MDVHVVGSFFEVPQQDIMVVAISGEDSVELLQEIVKNLEQKDRAILELSNLENSGFIFAFIPRHEESIRQIFNLPEGAKLEEFTGIKFISTAAGVFCQKIYPNVSFRTVNRTQLEGDLHLLLSLASYIAQNYLGQENDPTKDRFLQELLSYLRANGFECFPEPG